jgi:hypothetical protein
VQGKRKVYIILSDTGTWFTRLIRLYTKAPYNHVSISLDEDFTEVYSFGRKQPENPFIGGFVQEDFNGDLFKEATCAVYSCVVTDQQYRQIRSIVDKFKRNSDEYRYNLLGVIGIMLKLNIKREKAFFCSQFVASIFEQSGARIVHKSAALTTPADIGQSQALDLIYQGDLNSIAGRGEAAS